MKQAWYKKLCETRHPFLHQGWMTQSCRRKGSQKRATQSETSPVPIVRNLTRRQRLHNCNIYSEGLAQSHAGSLIFGSVAMSPYEPRLVGSVGFLVMFFILLFLQSLSPSFQGILKLCLMIDYRSLHLFPSVAGCSLPDESWVKLHHICLHLCAYLSKLMPSSSSIIYLTVNNSLNF